MHIYHMLGTMKTKRFLPSKRFSLVRGKFNRNKCTSTASETSKMILHHFFKTCVLLYHFVYTLSTYIWLFLWKKERTSLREHSQRKHVGLLVRRGWKIARVNIFKLVKHNCALKNSKEISLVGWKQTPIKKNFDKH